MPTNEPSPTVEVAGVRGGREGGPSGGGFVRSMRASVRRQNATASTANTPTAEGRGAGLDRTRQQQIADETTESAARRALFSSDEGSGPAPVVSPSSARRRASSSSRVPGAAYGTYRNAEPAAPGTIAAAAAPPPGASLLPRRRTKSQTQRDGAKTNGATVGDPSSRASTSVTGRRKGARPPLAFGPSSGAPPNVTPIPERPTKHAFNDDEDAGADENPYLSHPTTDTAPYLPGGGGGRRLRRAMSGGGADNTNNNSSITNTTKSAASARNKALRPPTAPRSTPPPSTATESSASPSARRDASPSSVPAGSSTSTGTPQQQQQRGVVTVPIRWESILLSNAVTARVARERWEAEEAAAAADGGTTPSGTHPSYAFPSSTSSHLPAAVPSDVQLFYWRRDPFDGSVRPQPITRVQCGRGPPRMGPADDDIEVVLGLRAVHAAARHTNDSSPSPPPPPLPEDDLEQKVRELPMPELEEEGAAAAAAAAAMRSIRRDERGGHEARPYRASEEGAPPIAASHALHSFRGAVVDNNFAMDLVHTYTVARLTLDMAVGDLAALGLLQHQQQHQHQQQSATEPSSSPLLEGGLEEGSDDGLASRDDDSLGRIANGWRWQWESAAPTSADTNGRHDHRFVPNRRRRPLRIICHAAGNANSAYHRSKQALKFHFHTDAALRARVYTCRSFDVVAHETAHAVLDSLCPHWYRYSGAGELAALHEGYADATALFALLDRTEVRESAVAALAAVRGLRHDWHYYW